MKRLFGIAAVGALAVAVGSTAVVKAPAASVTKIVYHSKLGGRNNEILVVGSAG